MSTSTARMANLKTRQHETNADDCNQWRILLAPALQKIVVTLLSMGNETAVAQTRIVISQIKRV